MLQHGGLRFIFNLFTACLLDGVTRVVGGGVTDHTDYRGTTVSLSELFHKFDQ
jgi:hypothetical protein